MMATFSNEYESKYEIWVEREKLRAENERLREALKEIFLTEVVSFVHANYRGEYPVEFAVMNLQEIARKALEETE